MDHKEEESAHDDEDHHDDGHDDHSGDGGHHDDEHEDPHINNVTIRGIGHDILGDSDGEFDAVRSPGISEPEGPY